jgi:allantoicase
MPLSHFIDLASERVGGSVVAANDAFFAGRENLVRAAEPIERDLYVATGKWMDGWETRRRREPGHDWAIVRLGLRGVIRELVVDTSFFRGNFPEHCSVEACDVPGQPSPEELERPEVSWFELLPRSPLEGDHKNRFAIDSDRPVNYLRLRIYPDGGVARLHALGEVMPDWELPDLVGELVDLAGVARGGRVVDASDMFYGDPQNMLMPERARDMSDGWETQRRRQPGNDWVIVRLGAAGRIARVELDTSHFKGNAPGQASLEICSVEVASRDELRDESLWQPLLERTRLLPHTVHRFQDELTGGVERARYVRLQVYPDGGMARLRIWGRTERSERLLIRLGAKNALPPDRLREELLRSCSSPRWAAAMSECAPFSDAAALLREADRVWRGLGREDYLAAFASHPRIGEKKPAAAGAGGSRAWSEKEQAGTRGAPPAVLAALADGNRAYEERFGHIYLVCASGRTAEQMLDDLTRRMQNDLDTELAVAAEEQRKITRLRLVKWLAEQGAK